MAYCNVCDPVQADEIKRRRKAEISIRKSLVRGLGMPLPLIRSSLFSSIHITGIREKYRELPPFLPLDFSAESF